MPKVFLFFRELNVCVRVLQGHAKCVEYIKSFNLPLLMLGGGGYTIRNVARCWTYETAVALDCSIPNELPYNDYFEYFGPDFKLHISPSNMTNQNTNEYLEKIKQRLFENLRMLPHAPGVQMQAIPEDAPHPDSGDEDEEDPDKRVSSKRRTDLVRHTQRPGMFMNCPSLLTLCAVCCVFQSGPTIRG